ncbi:uncharacterized protein LOC116844570 isoform X2 [Odontomachus brunneus]|uniref:uncharacterized protein LOC116844570 isoform X2 n=1 Tax=Odontomachus brunneus TaxID=486640 RepID=UPI0013F1D2F9|nr:uncharacterized protein LOC116844570 isoform X2 [Odontomachus brunneus]
MLKKRWTLRDYTRNRRWVSVTRARLEPTLLAKCKTGVKNTGRSSLRQTAKLRTIARRYYRKTKKLSEWKAKREKEKSQEKLQKRPPFKVGIVHHRVYSPISSINTAVANMKKKVQAYTKPVVKMGITKATQKRLTQKAANVTKSPSAVLKTESFQKLKDDKIKVSVKNDKSFAPSNHKFKPPTLVPLFGKVLIEDNLNLENDFCGQNEATESFNEDVASDTIEAIKLQVSSDEREVSDCSQEERSSQGEKSTLCETSDAKQSSEISSSTTEKKKDSVKEIILVFSNTENNVQIEEKKSSLEIQQSSRSDKLSRSKEAEMKCSNVSREEEEYTVQHFKYLLYTETERLQKLCEEWTEVQSQDDTVEEARCLIGQAIGQTSLLLKEKFQQFRGLVLDCEKGGSVFPVSCADLHGFWDLMYIAVKDCVSRFAKLEKLRASNWQEDEMEPSRLKSVAKKRRKLAKKGVVQRKQSLLRDFILIEKRKKKVRELQERKTMETASSWLISDTLDKCITPSMNNRKPKAPKKKFGGSQSERIPGKYSKSMYTSTPTHNSINMRSFHRLSTPLITMKINQLYNKYTPKLEGTVQRKVISLTPRLDTIMKSDDSRKSMSIRSTPRFRRDDSLISKALSDEELANISGEFETERDVGSSLKKVDNANVSKPHSVERIRTEEQSSYYSPSEGDSTLKWYPPLNETVRAEGKNDTSALSLHDFKDVSLSGHISNRSRRDSSEKSLVRSVKSQTTCENAETPCATQSIENENIFSTPHTARNFSSEKFTLDRTDMLKNQETSIKILRNRSISIINTPKISRRKKMISTDKENTVQSEGRSSAKPKKHSTRDGTPNVRDINEKMPVKVARNNSVASI